MSKYDPLRDKLLGLPADLRDITLTFGDLENVLGFKLPHSAYTHPAWWANPSSAKDHPHAQSWLAAGWKVQKANQDRRWVRFVRI